MIPRYSRKEMKEIWSDQAKYHAWLEVELQACEAWSALGVIPKEDCAKLRANASFTCERIAELEKETRHDVVAFTRCVSESLGPEKKWVHYGLTSTDVVDTANGLLFQKANALIDQDLQDFMKVLKANAIKYKDTIMMGRTHGVHAEITTFGMKYCLWLEEMRRNYDRFQLARKGVECGKISGAVGTFANIPPEVQDLVCQNLHLESAKISTQVLQRDRHAFYFATLALIGTSLEQMATEIRLLQQTEIREVEECFRAGQKGSSAMPHKRNPIGCENICGCARVLRGYMNSAYEDVSLWHERDISHSCVERIIAPDACCLLDYMLNRFAGILENLTVFPKRMEENIWCTHGVIFSQRFMLKLIEKGWTREKAYDTVQPLAIESWEKETSFKDLILQNKDICQALTKEEIEECFDPKYEIRNVNLVYQRCGL